MTDNIFEEFKAFVKTSYQVMIKINEEEEVNCIGCSEQLIVLKNGVVIGSEDIIGCLGHGYEKIYAIWNTNRVCYVYHNILQREHEIEYLLPLDFIL